MPQKNYAELFGRFCGLTEMVNQNPEYYKKNFNYLIQSMNEIKNNTPLPF